MKYWMLIPAFLILGGGLTMGQSASPAPESLHSGTGATIARPFVNSLGMRFVPIPGTRALFSIWDTRVQDFQQFVKETGYDVSQGMISLTVAGMEPVGFDWKDPGFTQGPTYPVVGVNWMDAQAFCKWLTAKERKAGKIGPDQEYRLPTDQEWSRAVGGGIYPWGNQWPPPPGAGNYAGSEAIDGHWPEGTPTINGYKDPYPRTSPVGSFPQNEFGLFDMGGNVSQWCQDWYRSDMNTPEALEKMPKLRDDGGGNSLRLFRGVSWSGRSREYLMTAVHDGLAPSTRISNLGFRCVLAAVQ